MKKVNAAGPEVLGRLPIIPALAPATFKQMVEEKKSQLVDTRSMLAFGGGHIDGALNIAASPILSIWAGWLLDPEKPVLLVLESDGDVPLRRERHTLAERAPGPEEQGLHGRARDLERFGDLGVREILDVGQHHG